MIEFNDISTFVYETLSKERNRVGEELILVGSDYELRIELGSLVRVRKDNPIYDVIRLPEKVFWRPIGTRRWKKIYSIIKEKKHVK